MHSVMEHVQVGHQQQHSLNCSTKKGKCQHIGRSSVSNIQNTSNRVDAVVQTIFNVWEIPQIYGLATRWNCQIQTFVSPFLDELALSVDALCLIWQEIVGYAHPPVILIPKILQKIKSSNCIIILIAPFWTRETWFPDLAQLLIDYPVKRPRLQNFISQQRGRFHHPNIEMFKLTA